MLTRKLLAQFSSSTTQGNSKWTLLVSSTNIHLVVICHILKMAVFWFVALCSLVHGATTQKTNHLHTRRRENFKSHYHILLPTAICWLQATCFQ
jgi:hypothetical protein